jgi:hAT family C-terminal dimerisation region
MGGHRGATPPQLPFFAPPVEILSKCVLDTLLRLQLPIAELRGQTYDGASNMAGQYKGCQALICKEQPLALYVHCGAHCVNLVSQFVGESVIIIRDAMSSLQELCNLFSQSIKCRASFTKICESDAGVSKAQQLRPMCPTRWLVRVSAISALLNQYEQVLECLEEMSNPSSGTNVSARSSGLHAQLSKGAMLLAMKMALKIFSILEILNRSLQSRYQTVSGMLAAVAQSCSSLLAMREDAVFDEMLQETEGIVTKLDLEDISLPRQRKPPKRLTGIGAAHVCLSVSEYYRPFFFTLIDTAVQQLKERFSNSPGLNKYRTLEDVLISGVVDEQVLAAYHEIDSEVLQLQIRLFRRKRDIVSLRQAASILREMVPEVRGEFDEVEKLVRLLLVSPASSCEAERSFSALRRLKTWLRNSMTQRRLNSVALCNVHKHILDGIDIDAIVQLFASKNDTRAVIFGK